MVMPLNLSHGHVLCDIRALFIVVKRRIQPDVIITSAKQEESFLQALREEGQIFLNENINMGIFN